jgi:sodium transport system ATP-binding protein
MQAAVAFRGLVKRFPGQLVPALGGVSGRLETGERVALLGANGSGKTTLLRILATVIAPDSGSAAVGGYDVVRERGDARGSIGALIGGRGGLYHRLTVRENLAYFARLAGIPRREEAKRISELTARFRLDEIADQRVATLSTGMRQRAALLRALLQDPEVLLLDEPSTGLDLAAAGALERMIKDVASTGTTVVLASHDIHLVTATCDRYMLLRSGEVIRDGAIDPESGELRQKLLGAMIS